MQLNGAVIADEDQWLYDFFDIPAFSPQTIRNALEATEELTLEINSPGGSVFAAFEMYTVLQNAAPYTVAEVQSLAASAASILMLGCDEVIASPVAQIMIHLPSLRTEGNQADHLESIYMLNSITDSILNAYSIKCGGQASREELRRLMETSTWLSAPEAKGLGLVDKLLGEDRIDPSAVLNCAGGVSRFIRAAAGPVRDAAELRAEYKKLVAEGKAPARPGMEPDATEPSQDLQTAMAELELEKIRFLEGSMNA